MTQIAVLGYGTVGSGVVEVIKMNHGPLTQKVPGGMHVKYVLDLRDFPGDPVEEILVHDFDTILNDEEVKIVVEVMGGLEPAYTFVKQSLLKGKSVCTSNKELVARYGAELLSIAASHRVNFLFEASCGGGIPIIRTLNTSLAGENIEEISGILNGTTNYILTKMEKEQWDFDTALKSAQENGFAERNPEADIEGYDACRKIAILSSLAFGKSVDFEDIYTEGIRKITVRDLQNADRLGYRVKLLASCEKKEDQIFALVAPMLIGKEHPLCFVNGVFNAVFVRGNTLGSTMYYGQGAGKLPTASAVVSDIADACRNMDRTLPVFWSEEKLSLTGIENAERRFYVRMGGDQKDHEEQIRTLFGSGAVFGKKEPGDEDFCFITEKMSEKAFREAYGKLNGALCRIRVSE
ncbi:MAG: homoserine dehydrogenase [Lachnospiraceae bacterium]|nr:homoserine dehydrogenase [Lachnospiraceae bacterium]